MGLDYNTTANAQDPLSITVFKNHAAATKEAFVTRLPALRDLILGTSAASKDALPWLKLATFGDLRSKKGNSLRHDANVLEITGVELDYDQEQIPFDDAVEICRRARLSALVYTSPSHAPEKPRWRILLPRSQALTPEERYKLAARVNGLFGGVFADESFVISQSYYFGSVNGNPAHQAVIVEGDFVDLRADLDATAIGKKPRARRKRKGSRFEDILARVGNGPSLDGFHGPLRDAVASYVATHGATFDHAALLRRLRKAIDAAPMAAPHEYLDGDEHLNKLIDSAVAKFGVGDDDIQRLNATHAVLPISGKTRVVTFGELEEFPGRTTIIMTQTLDDFVNLNNKYRHDYIDEDGKARSIPLGTYWRNSPHRRQYDDGMAFMPGSKDVGNRLNLWGGYGVKPRKPDGRSGAAGCARFLKFANEVICSGNARDYDYLIKREATIVQKLIRTEVALALHTLEEGAGKGRFEKHMGHLLGNHYMQITNPKHIIGAFNPHLETLLRLTADEALFVGNHEHRNMLFGQITEGRLTIEPKGHSVYTARNYLNITIISNAKHFIPVSGTARRFFVPTVSTAHLQDRQYFRAIEDELVNEGGYEALLYHLLYEIDLRDFDVGVAPRTSGLAEQAAYGRRGVEGLVEMVCNEGRVPCEHPVWAGFTVTSGQEEDIGFYAYIDRSKDRELVGLTLTIIRRLAKEWGCTTGTRRREPGTQDRTSGFQWPPLAELRKRFEDRFGKQTWTNAQVTEWTVPGDNATVVTKVVQVVEETEKALHVADDVGQQAWLPKAMITTRQYSATCIEVSMPRTLAREKRMEAWSDVVP